MCLLHFLVVLSNFAGTQIFVGFVVELIHEIKSIRQQYSFRRLGGQQLTYQICL